MRRNLRARLSALEAVRVTLQPSQRRVSPHDLTDDELIDALPNWWRELTDAEFEQAASITINSARAAAVDPVDTQRLTKLEALARARAASITATKPGWHAR